jgi:hypothetical protein
MFEMKRVSREAIKSDKMKGETTVQVPSPERRFGCDFRFVFVRSPDLLSF